MSAQTSLKAVIEDWESEGQDHPPPPKKKALKWFHFSCSRSLFYAISDSIGAAGAEVNSLKVAVA